MLNINQLRTFVTVAEEKSISTAAEKFFITQPAVTVHIQNLEDSLGTNLLIRRGRFLDLNETGSLLLNDIKSLISLYEESELSIINKVNSLKSEIVVGAGPILTDYVLPHVIASFKREYPRVEVRIEQSDGLPGYIKSVLDHTFDLSIVGIQISNEKVDLEEWTDDELLLIVSPNHPFTEKEFITARDLKGQKIIMRKGITAIKAFLEEKLKFAGLKSPSFPSFVEVNSTMATITSVEAGLGISIASRLVVKQAIGLGKVVAIPIRDMSLTRKLYIMTRRNKKRLPVVGDFIKHLLEYRV